MVDWMRKKPKHCHTKNSLPESSRDYWTLNHPQLLETQWSLFSRMKSSWTMDSMMVDDADVDDADADDAAVDDDDDDKDEINQWLFCTD
jgi:hypothetical protein